MLINGTDFGTCRLALYALLVLCLPRAEEEGFCEPSSLTAVYLHWLGFPEGEATDAVGGGDWGGVWIEPSVFFVQMCAFWGFCSRARVHYHPCSLRASSLSGVYW